MNGSSNDLAGWRKSTYSGGGGGNCLEVWDGIPGLIPVRDSKAPHGPALVFSHVAFAAFVGALNRGEFSA
ncbi:toxin [Streptomyces chrestomyceticus JCM 4735]|uniref:Toxin n=1 Tax=Streptomyces chrestomyceticus JCM 4735 TaxID=1306181 RepID=A0A7U9L1B4_9ACTN|nr:DUF397 domain-containing protein [Streptomyces chrestomyceticus]GCD38552.1 toxin [Streptomyces chrestomyceticus JCM 4735]